MPDDPYTDPITAVLRNKLGLDTAEELAAAEREITHAALILIRESPVRPTYDLPHLCTIHRRIFGDIYEWAGQIRTVSIAKGSPFVLSYVMGGPVLTVLRRTAPDFPRPVRLKAVKSWATAGSSRAFCSSTSRDGCP